MRAGIPRSKKTQLTRPDQRTASFVSGREPRTLQVHGGRDTRGGGAMRAGKRWIQRRTRAGAASCIILGDRKATGDDQRGRPRACSSSSHGRGTLSEAKLVLSQKKLVNFLLPVPHSLSCADCTERERERNQEMGYWQESNQSSESTKNASYSQRKNTHYCNSVPMLLLQISTKPRDGSPRERRRHKKQHNPTPLLPLPLPPLHKTPKKPADKNLSQCGVFGYRFILLTRRKTIQWEMNKKKKKKMKIPNFGYEEEDDDDDFVLFLFFLNFLS